MDTKLKSTKIDDGGSEVTNELLANRYTVPLEKQPKTVSMKEKDATIVKLTASNINFFYGTFQALHNIDLSFTQNRIAALIGPVRLWKINFHPHLESLARNHTRSAAGRRDKT